MDGNGEHKEKHENTTGKSPNFPEGVGGKKKIGKKRGK